MGLSRYMSARLLEASVGKSSITTVPQLYLALLTTPASVDDTGTTIAPKEISFPGWARVALPATAWGVAQDFELRNVTPISLPVPTSWPTPPIVAFALCEDPTGGEMRFRGECRPFHLAGEDPEPQIPAGVLRIVLA